MISLTVTSILTTVCAVSPRALAVILAREPISASAEDEAVTVTKLLLLLNAIALFTSAAMVRLSVVVIVPYTATFAETVDATLLPLVIDELSNALRVMAEFEEST